jgi:basic membrane protein A
MDLGNICNKQDRSRPAIRTITWFVAIVIISAGAFLSCGKPPKKDTLSSKILVILAAGSKDDKSYNSSIWMGCQKIVEEYGITMDVLEPKTQEEAEKQLTDGLSRGVELVVAAPRLLQDKVNELAPAYSQTDFVVFDSSIDLPNVASYNFDNYSAGVLGGVLTGGSILKGEVGFIGCDNTQFTADILRGFADGLQYSNPSLSLLSETVPGGFSAAADEEKAKELALKLYAQGCQVVFAPCGAGSQGVLAAAAENRMLAVGADANQNWVELGYVLSSVTRALDRAAYEALKSHLEGNFAGGKHTCGLSDSWIGIVRDKSNEKMLNPEVMQKVEEVRQLLLAGKFNPQKAT